MRVCRQACTHTHSLPLARVLCACRSTTPPQVYPPVWPNLALHYAMLAKLEMLLCRPALARVAAQGAVSGLRLTHGGGGLVDDMLRLQQEAEQEVLAGARGGVGGGGVV